MKCIWIPKAIAAVSVYPFYSHFEIILQDIHAKIFNELKKTEFQLHEDLYIKAILDIPAPKHDSIAVQFPLFKASHLQHYDMLRIMRPPTDKLPHADLNHFNVLLNMMDAEEIVNVCKYLLCGKKAILFCHQTELLLPISMTLNNLIFPLEIL